MPVVLAAAPVAKSRTYEKDGEQNVGARSLTASRCTVVVIFGTRDWAAIANMEIGLHARIKR
jgi:hypothetical protein